MKLILILMLIGAVVTPFPVPRPIPRHRPHRVTAPSISVDDIQGDNNVRL